MVLYGEGTANEALFGRPQSYENTYKCWETGAPITQKTLRKEFPLLKPIPPESVPPDFTVSPDGKSLEFSASLQNISWPEEFYVPEIPDAYSLRKYLPQLRTLNVNPKLIEDIEQSALGDSLKIALLNLREDFDITADQLETYGKTIAEADGKSILEQIDLLTRICEESEDLDLKPEGRQGTQSRVDGHKAMKHVFDGDYSALDEQTRPFWPSFSLWFDGYPGKPNSNRDAPAFAHLSAQMEKIDNRPVMPINLTNIQVLRLPAFNANQWDRVRQLRNEGVIDMPEPAYFHVIICEDPARINPTSFELAANKNYGYKGWILCSRDPDGRLVENVPKERKHWKVTSKKVPDVYFDQIRDIT